MIGPSIANGISSTIIALNLGTMAFSYLSSAMDFFQDVSKLNCINKQSIVSVKKHFKGIIYIIYSILGTFFIPYNFPELFTEPLLLIFKYISIFSFVLSIAYIQTIHHDPKKIKTIYLNLVPLLFELTLISYVIL